MVTVEGPLELVLDHVPDEDGLAHSGRGQKASVRGPAAPKHFVGMAFERFKHVPVVPEVPNLLIGRYEKQLLGQNQKKKEGRIP